MEKIWFYYYSILLMLVIAAGLYYFIVGVANHAKLTEHHIGVNMTKNNDTCRVVWLGGWDFDSFYGNVTVNGINVGHPAPITEIYNDTCKNITVLMYDKAVHTDVELYRYNHTGVP